MPIEIRELQIKAVIDNGNPKGKKGASPGSPGEGPQQNPDELVDLCVEKVLEILKEKGER
jgi:hypothetical protein